jgi:hypothetical protein
MEWNESFNGSSAKPRNTYPIPISQIPARVALEAGAEVLKWNRRSVGV